MCLLKCRDFRPRKILSRVRDRMGLVITIRSLSEKIELLFPFPLIEDDPVYQAKLSWEIGVLTTL